MSIPVKPFKEIHLVSPLFPVRIHHNLHTFSFPPHYHRELEVIFVRTGYLDIEVNHTAYHLLAGDLLIIGAHHIHTYKNDDNGDTSDYFLLIFDWTYLDALGKDKQTYSHYAPILLQTNHFRQSNYPSLVQQINPILDLLTEEYNCTGLGRELIILGNLYTLLTLTLRALNDHVTAVYGSKQLEKTHTLIHNINRLILNHYTREITLSEAAEAAGYSQYHFARLFKELTNFTFIEYLNNFRINMVKEALLSTDLPITDVAYQHGFNSIKSFNRNFKEITGTTPTLFKISNI